MSSEQKQEQPKSVVDKSTEQNIPPSESDLEVTTMQVSLKPTKRSIQSVREVDHFKSENTVDTSISVPESLKPGEEEEVVLDSF